MYGYWDRQAEDKGSLVNKIDGLAKLAGIIGLGVASRPYWSKLAGRVSANAAQKLGGRLTGSSTRSAVTDLFGEEVGQQFFQFMEDIRKQVASVTTRKQRLNTFFEMLREHVDDSTKTLFDDVKDDFRSQASVFAKIGDMEDTDVDTVVLNPKAIRKLKSAMEDRGIKFTEGFQRDHIRRFEEIAAATSKIGPDREAIEKYLASEENQKELHRAFNDFYEKQKQRTNVIGKFISFEGSPDFEHITGRDLLDTDGAKAQAVNTYLKKVGVQADNPVAQIIEEARELHHGKDKGIFKAMETAMEDRSLEDLFQERVRKLQTTGLMINKKTGEVFSISRLRQERIQYTETLLDELQIPLIPFKANIPLKVFRFMKPTNDVIRNLGNVGLEPELRREFLKNGVTRQQLGQLQGLGIDDRLMSFSEDDTIRYHDKGFKRIVSYERRKNQNINNMLNVRDQDPDDLRSYARDFRGAEDSISRQQKAMFAIMPKISDVAYDTEKGGFVIQAKESANAAQRKLVEMMYTPGKVVDIEDINPIQLSQYLDSQDAFTMNAMGHMGKYAQRYVLAEASQDRRDLSGLISKLQPFVASNSPFSKYVRALIDNAGDPKKLAGIFGEINTEVTRDGGKLYNQVAPGFFRAVETFVKNPFSLFEVSQGEAGFLNSQMADFAGERGIGAGLQKAQEAILSQVMREHSIEQLAADLAGGSSTSDDIVRILASVREKLLNNGGQDLPLMGEGSQVLLEKFSMLGLSNQTGTHVSQNAVSLIDTIVDGEGNLISRDQLGKFALATLDHDQRRAWLELTPNLTEKAKIIQDMAEAANALSILHDTEVGLNQHLQLLTDMRNDLGVTDVLSKRFTLTKPWQPREAHLSPLNINNYYSVTNSAPNLLDLFTNPSQIPDVLKEQFGRGFGIPEFIQGLTMPDQALGSFGAATQMLLTMPQNIANELGLGLRGQDRLTALRTVSSFYGKRVLPLVIGHEAYKNYNANMHSIGVPGLDDMAANLIANINLTGASLKDQLGITGLSQWAVGTMPGLDQYASPRSRDEYEEYLKYGNEEVREGRGWLYGSRTPLAGGKVKYVRPNAYRRWKSHWTEADNVDISNPHYSFLPNLQNPLAPVSLLLNPDWWQEKHRSDRPYLPGGVGTHSPADWARNDNYITINSQGGYGALGIGEIGGGYPTSMTGGGYDVSYDMRSDSLVTGAQGTGGGAQVPQMGAQMSAQVYGGVYQQHTFGLEAAGKPIRLGLHKAVPQNQLIGFSLPGAFNSLVGAVRTQAGMYGAVMARMPFYPDEQQGFVEQTPGAARSFSRQAWMGEYGEMPFGPIGTAKEFFRRFVTPDSEGYDAWNPLPNNMPSWLPDKFKTGDPYMRTPGIGELQLPGDAWERTHPWVAPLRVRGSAIGLSEKEMIQKWLNPLEEMEDQDAQDIVDFGSAVHLQIQRQLRQIGALVGAEVSIYDKEHNFSGTVDAIVRGQEGMEILEIKTQGQKSWGQTPEKYKDQLTFYMATTGIHRGKLAFVNRDDPQQVRIENVEFDPYRWQNIIDRAERARATMRDLQDKGLVSPFETYDLVSRIEILGKVAPNSAEFRDHVEHALQGGLGGFEKQRVNQAIKEAEDQSKDYRLYARRYGVDLAKARLEVEGIGSNGEIITDQGVVKLAGVEFDPQAFSFEDPETVLSKFGVNVGDSITVQMMKGAMNPEVMSDITTPVIIGDINERLVKTGYGKWDESTQSNPVASQARYGNQVIGGLWEGLVHSDNIVTNKFMRVRTALEQFERGEVYGTDEAKWNDPINSFVKPTISSLIHKDPLTAAIQGGVVAAMFARTNSAASKIPYLRTKLAAGGAIAAGTLATLREIGDGFNSDIWTPSRYREQAAFDEYWDIIRYLKFTSIAESAKKLALEREGVNLDKMREGEREIVGLGPYAILAIDAERKAKRTMFGFDVMSGSLQDAISTLPKRQQQIAQEIVESGTLEEKQRFYDLLPDAQRRVIGKFLGVEQNELPKQQNLTKYFQSHFLPNVDWAGWSRNTDLQDIENRAAAVEGMKIDKPNRARSNKSRSLTNNIPVPRMDNPTYGNVRRQINNLLSSGGYHNIGVDFRMLPSDSTVVNVGMNLFDDQTDEIIDHYRREGI
jgi:hypothetical protein